MTELGEIPEKWEVKKLVDLCNIITKQTGFDYTSTIKPNLLSEYRINTVPMLQTKNFKGVNIDLNTDFYIPKDIAFGFPKILLNQKCLLFSIVGASVGNIGLFNEKSIAFLGGAICVAKFIDIDDVELVYYSMLSIIGQKQIKHITKGGAQATITIEDIRELKIPRPPLSEQQRIVKILSSNEELITKTYELIKKAKEIKQGLMQELLTKGIEHSDFKDSDLGRIPKEWEVYGAGDIFESVSIKNYPHERVLTVTQDRGTIYRDDCGINIKTDSSSLRNFKLVHNGNFIISLRSFQGGIENTNLRGIVSPAYTVLSNIKPINETFFKYFFKSQKFINILDSAVIGIRDGKQISYEVFKSLLIPYPPLEEQQEIASILSSIDNKIKVLSKRKQQLEEIIQGLMQDLLTGKVRVN